MAHGIVDVAKDQPCPSCGALTYDLGDRSARDVVRANRETALKGRKTAAGVAVFVIVAALGFVASPIHVVVLGLDLVPLVLAGIAAAAGARPIALALERERGLKALDTALTKQKL